MMQNTPEAYGLALLQKVWSRIERRDAVLSQMWHASQRPSSKKKRTRGMVAIAPTTNLKKIRTGKEAFKEQRTMVYCTKCGAKNEDDAAVCVKCGADLGTGKRPSRRYARKRWEEECFGLPYGGTIVGIVIGILIVLWGVFWVASDYYQIPTPSIMAIAMVIFGILIVVGALYKYGRRY